MTVRRLDHDNILTPKYEVPGMRPRQIFIPDPNGIALEPNFPGD